MVRARTNFRKGKDVFLYWLKLTPDEALARFREYLAALTFLRENPH